MGLVYKFGYSTATGEDKPFNYPNTWAVEKTSIGSERLIIAPNTEHVVLIRGLSELMTPPFWVLYVLLVPRTRVHSPGRYQNPQPLTRKQLAAFLDRFRNYFEHDARHDVWVSEADGSSLLVYDQHNIIYAYGPLREYEQKLREKGLEQSQEVALPAPHSHHYNPEYDVEEAALVNYFRWRISPLQEEDDEA